MKSRDFCFWLQGFFEISEKGNITESQVQIIKNHLNLVFLHEIDPSIDGGNPVVKEKLDAVHRPPGGPGPMWC